MEFNEVVKMVKGLCEGYEGKEFDDIVRKEWEKVENKEEFGFWLLGRLCGKKLDKEGGRKDEMRKLLEGGERYKISELSKILGISDKNVSSLLSYLRKDGLKICIDSEGRRFIEK